MKSLILVITINVLFSFISTGQNIDSSRFIKWLSFETKDYYGLKPFLNYAEALPREEFFYINNGKRIYFREYILINKNKNENIFYYFKFFPAANTYFDNGTDSSNRGLINIAFWGVKPLKNSRAVEVTPTRNKFNVPGLITDILNERPDYFFRKDEIGNLVLIIAPILPHESYIEKYLNKQIIVRHSSLLYIIWDKSKVNELPEFIKNKNYYEIPVKLNEDIAINNENNIPKNENVLNFKSSNPPVVIKYIIKRNNRPDLINFIRKDTFFSVKLINHQFARQGDAEKIIIEKPYGYNIFPSTKQDTSDWLSNKIEFDVSDPESIELNYKKLPPFGLYYIEMSDFSNKTALINSLNKEIENGNSQLFFMYLSNSKKPYVAENKSEYIDFINKIVEISIDPPIIMEDVKIINNIINLKQICGRTLVKYNFILSKMSYQLSFNDLYSNLLISSTEKPEVSLYLDYKETKTIKDFKYIIIN